jgi:uncharacterized Fe-S center protein
VSRVHFAPAVGHEPPEAVAERAWRLCAEALDGSDLQDGAAVAYAIDRQPRRRAEAQFRSWTEVLPTRLAARGWNLRPLAPISAPEAAGVEVAVPGGAVAAVSLSRTAHAATGLFFCRRVVCHPVSGLDGALAGLVYGCMSAAGKRSLQEGLQPRVERTVCGGCGLCVTLCDRDGIRYDGHVSRIRPDNCLVCGDCRLECATLALQFPPDAAHAVQKRMAAVAAAAAARKRGRMLWVLFLLGEPERHGVNLGRVRTWPDLGILAGCDPVALDAAARHLILRETGRSLRDWNGGPDDPDVLLAEAERLGVGSGAYELVERGR